MEGNKRLYYLSATPRSGMSVGDTREFRLGLETGDLSSQLGVGVGGVACPVSQENEPKTNQDGC